MGGSGGGGLGKFVRSEEELNELREKAKKNLEQQELAAERNKFLAECLVNFNQRDTEEARERLDAVQVALEEMGHEVQKFLFGGSVAKHTYVNGLSDVDALVFLSDEQGSSPAEVLRQFGSALGARLRQGDIDEIKIGNMAVTIKYRDGGELQLLPAIERGSHTVIASSNGREWRQVRPHKFAEKLTQTNAENGGGVVPVIKLAKSLIDGLPDGSRISGYHVEAIAVDAFKSYEGNRDRASMLAHLINHASKVVLRPTGDITGQSVHIDSDLGAANSDQRKTVSNNLGLLGRRLSNAPTIQDYREVFEPPGE